MATEEELTAQLKKAKADYKAEHEALQSLAKDYEALSDELFQYRHGVALYLKSVGVQAGLSSFLRRMNIPTR